jgi:POT family proton-dependent oligopeptide transporter
MRTRENILDHPPGLYYLTFTEMWERFSYYGMTALLVLYMVDQLLLPGHVGQVAGFAQLRTALQSLAGPLSDRALASQIFGLYSGLVYFTPLLGGLIADRWIGQRNAVVIGALAMCAGHLAMAYDRSFLLALLLLVIGSGFLKGNISAQVGALYPSTEEARRTHGFVIFSTGINFGAAAGPVLCGWVAQTYGWHYGFTVAAIFMLLGLAIYLSGYRHLPPRVVRRGAPRAPLSAADWRVVLALAAIILISVFQTIAYYQSSNVLPLWVQDHVALDIGRFRLPIAWFQSIDSLVAIAFVPCLLWIWRRQARGHGEPHDLGKIGIGAWIIAAANLMLAGIAWTAGSTPVSALWPILYFVFLGVAFLYYWPPLLALVSRAAPVKLNATMMGLVFTSMFVANVLIGWLGGYYERMTPAAFWGLHAGIAAVSGLLLRQFGGRLNRVLGSAAQPLRAGP